MSTHRKINLSDVKDLAPDFGKAEMGTCRSAREALGASDIGMTLYEMNAGQRVGFGHRHEQVEEVYLVLSGTGRFKVEDEILDIGPRDTVFCPADAMREWEAGPDGLDLVAFGGHAAGDGKMEPGWWTD